MLKKIQKEEAIRELNDKLDRKKVVFLSDFRGISVMNAQELRRALKKTDAEYKVAKKTLFDRALSEHGIEYKTRELEGQIGAAFGYGEETAPAKVLVKFRKDHDSFKILGAILGDKILTEQQVTAMAKLPAREILLGQVIGAMQAPIRGLAAVLQANIGNLAIVLQKVGEQSQTV
ncbi:MAG: 50S ribosomal protein L10 [Candidatus Sungbacteria bacterium]|nr:50S ribosomal protein L10 [Candidatus Sungbacteria bacterium]